MMVSVTKCQSIFETLFRASPKYQLEEPRQTPVGVLQASSEHRGSLCKAQFISILKGDSNRLAVCTHFFTVIQ